MNKESYYTFTSEHQKSFLMFILGFDRYKGGLDTVHDLTGLYSVFTRWRGIEIMFHISTHLPNEPDDHQKVSVFLNFF